MITTFSTEQAKVVKLVAQVVILKASLDFTLTTLQDFKCT
jgi:hypothetical protein